MRQDAGAASSSYLSRDNAPELPALSTCHATTHRSCRLFLLVMRQRTRAASSSYLSRDNAPEPPALPICHATTRWSCQLFLLVTRLRLTLYIVMGAGDLARGLTMLNRCVARSGTCGQSPPHGLDLEGVEPLRVRPVRPRWGRDRGDIGYRRCRWRVTSRLSMVGRFHRPLGASIKIDVKFFLKN